MKYAIVCVSGSKIDGNSQTKIGVERTMSERTQLLKKAVLTSVGATTSVDKIKDAIKEAMEDLVKVGQDLMCELESTGQTKTESFQNFLTSFQDEAGKRTADISTTVQTRVKNAAREFGLVTREEYDELLKRLEKLEEAKKTSRSTKSKKTSPSA